MDIVNTSNAMHKAASTFMGVFVSHIETHRIVSHCIASFCTAFQRVMENAVGRGEVNEPAATTI